MLKGCHVGFHINVPSYRYRYYQLVVTVIDSLGFHRC